MRHHLLVLFHLVGVVLFFANVVASLFWMLRAGRSRDAKIVAHTFRTLNDADRWITPLAVSLLVVPGTMAAIRGGFGPLSTGWILWSIVALLASGAVFGSRLLPLQLDLARWTRAGADRGAFDWERYRIESRRWLRWALVSLLAALVGLVLMVVRPSLPALGSERSAPSSTRGSS